MLATLTSKGQVKLPKQIRDKLGLKTGSKLHFELLPDGTVKLRPANRTALSHDRGSGRFPPKKWTKALPRFWCEARAEAVMVRIDRAMRPVAGINGL